MSSTDEADEGARPVRARPRGTGQWLRLVFLAAVLLFGGLFVARRWDDLRSALGQASWPPVAGSVVVGGGGMFASMLAWRSLLAACGATLPVPAAARVFFAGQLGKYLPGSVWSVLAQAELARAHRVPRIVTVVVSLLGIVLSVGVGAVVAMVLLPFGSVQAAQRYWWVVAVIPLYLVAMHPRVVGWGMRLLFRLLRRGTVDQVPDYAGMLRASGWQALAWVLLGMHAWLLVLAFGGDPLRSLPVTVGGFALAFCLGLIVVPVPAGAGIRDAALTVALGPVLAPSAALAVALISRIVLVAVDFGLAGGQWLLNRGVPRVPAGREAPTRVP